VFVYHKGNELIKALFIVAFVGSVVRFLVEIYGIRKVVKEGKTTAAYTVADDGSLGPIFYVAARAGCIAKFKDTVPPEADPYSWSDWFLLQAYEAVVNIAMPAAALAGCKASRLLSRKLVLLIIGIVKFVALLAYNVFKRVRGDSAVVVNNVLHTSASTQ
jgi:hypothetical protein